MAGGGLPNLPPDLAVRLKRVQSPDIQLFLKLRRKSAVRVISNMLPFRHSQQPGCASSGVPSPKYIYPCGVRHWTTE